MKLSLGDLLYHSGTHEIGMIVRITHLRKLSAVDPQYLYKVEWNNGETTTYFSNSPSLENYRHGYFRLRKNIKHE